MTSGAGVGDGKLRADYAEVLLMLVAIDGRLSRIEDRLSALDPLLPHIPAALRMLDNPATRWKARRERANTRT